MKELKELQEIMIVEKENNQNSENKGNKDQKEKYSLLGKQTEEENFGLNSGAETKYKEVPLLENDEITIKIKKRHIKMILRI